MGVLEALRIYASWISCRAEAVALKCLWTWDSRTFEVADGLLIEDMAYRRDILNPDSALTYNNAIPRLEERKPRIFGTKDGDYNGYGRLDPETRGSFM